MQSRASIRLAGRLRFRPAGIEAYKRCPHATPSFARVSSVFYSTSPAGPSEGAGAGAEAGAGAGAGTKEAEAKAEAQVEAEVGAGAETKAETGSEPGPTTEAKAEAEAKVEQPPATTPSGPAQPENDTTTADTTTTTTNQPPTTTPADPPARPRGPSRSTLSLASMRPFPAGLALMYSPGTSTKAELKQQIRFRPPFSLLPRDPDRTGWNTATDPLNKYPEEPPAAAANQDCPPDDRRRLAQPPFLYAGRYIPPAGWSDRDQAELDRPAITEAEYAARYPWIGPARLSLPDASPDMDGLAGAGSSSSTAATTTATPKLKRAPKVDITQLRPLPAAVEARLDAEIGAFDGFARPDPTEQAVHAAVYERVRSILDRAFTHESAPDAAALVKSLDAANPVRPVVPGSLTARIRPVGSVATGTAMATSDVDIQVVVPCRPMVRHADRRAEHERNMANKTWPAPAWPELDALTLTSWRKQWVEAARRHLLREFPVEAPRQPADEAAAEEEEEEGAAKRGGRPERLAVNEFILVTLVPHNLFPRITALHRPSGVAVQVSFVDNLYLALHERSKQNQIRKVLQLDHKAELGPALAAAFGPKEGAEPAEPAGAPSAFKDVYTPLPSSDAAVLEYTSSIPAVRPVYAVLKTAFDLRSLTDTHRKGLPSYGLLMLLVAVALQAGDRAGQLSPAQLLRSFLHFYTNFDSRAWGVSIRPPMYFPRADLLSDLGVQPKRKEARGKPDAGADAQDGKEQPAAEPAEVTPLDIIPPRRRLSNPLYPDKLVLLDPANPLNDLAFRALAWRHISTTITVLFEQLEKRLLLLENSMVSPKPAPAGPDELVQQPLLAHLVGAAVQNYEGRRERMKEWNQIRLRCEAEEKRVQEEREKEKREREESAPETSLEQSAPETALKEPVQEPTLNELAQDEAAPVTAQGPTREESTREESGLQESGLQESAPDTSPSAESTSEKSALPESVRDETAAEKPAQEEPVSEETVPEESAPESALEKPAREESTPEESSESTSESTSERSARDESTTETEQKPAREESAVEEPAPQEPTPEISQEPVPKEPVVEKAVSEAAESESPVVSNDGTAPDGTGSDAPEHKAASAEGDATKKGQ